MRLRELLWSVYWDFAWPAAPFTADCVRRLRGEPVLHEPPDRDCLCGIYVLKDRTQAEELARGMLAPLLALGEPVVLSDDATTVAIGRVSIWGRVIETEKGYRAEFAYPYDIAVLDGTPEQARALRDRYAIDVSMEPVPPEWRARAREEARTRAARAGARLPDELVAIPVRQPSSL